MSRKPNKSTMIVRILCAMVFLSLGFAHKTPAALAANIQSVEFSLPDGTYADLCIADRGQKHAPGLKECEACRLSAAIALPTPAATDWLLTTFVSLANAKRNLEIFTFDDRVELPRSRGPPAIA